MYYFQVSRSTSGYDLTVVAGQKLLARYSVEFLANDAAPDLYGTSGLEVLKQIAKSHIRALHRWPHSDTLRERS